MKTCCTHVVQNKLILEIGAKPTCSPPGMRKRDCAFFSYLPTDWLCYCHLATDL